MTVPAPRPSLDRSALERVLARAAELQAQDSGDGGGNLSDDQILDLGKEVGLTPDAMRQAIAEERGRVLVPEAKGVTGGWFGAATISATRVVPGNAAAVLAALNGVMCNDLPFDVSRRFPDRIQWAPKRGLLDRVRSEFARSPEAMDLKLAGEIAASVVSVDGQRTHVRLDASLEGSRSGAMSQTIAAIAVTGSMGGIAAIAGAVLTIAVPLLGAVAAIAVISARNSYRHRVVRVGTALEQVLDRMEFGPAERKRGIVDRLLG